MKLDELMRGDWVYLCGTPCRVKDIVDDGVINYEKDVTPIPLTPEILEKNGYFYDKKHEVYQEIPTTGFGITVEDDGDFYFSIGVFDPYCDIVYHNIAKVKYVHNLQHIVKSVYESKEIVL